MLYIPKPFPLFKVQDSIDTRAWDKHTTIVTKVEVLPKVLYQLHTDITRAGFTKHEYWLDVGKQQYPWTFYNRFLETRVWSNTQLTLTEARAYHAETRAAWLDYIKYLPLHDFKDFKYVISETYKSL